jgi:hypothetical protein
MSPPSQGYESTRMVPECYLASQTSQHSSSHRLPNTHNNPSTQLSSTQPTQPKRMDPHPSLPCSPSGSPSPSRALVQLVQNLHVGTLRTRSCEQSWTQAKHLRHAGLKSWLDYTNNLYNQQYHGFSSTVCLPFPSQDTDEER